MQNRFAWISASLWVFFALGTAHAADTQAPKSADKIDRKCRATRNAQEATMASSDTCEVRLYLESTDGAIVACDSNDGYAGVCVKRQGSPLIVPAGIQLWLRNGRSVDTDHVWGLFWRRNSTPICAESDLKDDNDQCSWNGIVRDKFRLTFRVASARQVPLARYVAAIRFYLNGEQKFAWTANDLQREVQIPNTAFGDARLLPYDVNFDLHLIAPAGSPEISTQKIIEESLPGQLSRLAQTSLLTIQSLGANLDQELAKNLTCLSEHLRFTSGVLVQLAQFEILEPGEVNSSNSSACESLGDGYEVEVLKSYFDSIDAGTSLAQEEQQKAEKLLNDLSSWLANQSGAEIHAIEEKLVELGGPSAADLVKVSKYVKDLKGKLQAVRSLDEATRDGIVRSITAARQIASHVRRVARDTSAQNQIFRDYAARLEANGGPFAERHPNPPPAVDSSVLFMRYVDVFQTFVLAPWHAVPIRITGLHAGGELSAGNALPVIDVVGARWQWSRSRFADLRLGLGAFYLPDVYTSNAGTPNQTTQDVFNPGVEANVALANFHAGLGYVVGDRVQANTFNSRARLMIGVDLYKLVSGENLEAN